MKIDNSLFRFVLEKKKKGGTVLPLLLCLMLLAGVFGGGVVLGGSLAGQDSNASVHAGSPPKEGKTEDALNETDGGMNLASAEEDEYVEGNYITSTYLAGMTRDKYKDAVSPYGYTYGTAITGLSRQDSIVLKADFAVEELGIEYWTEIIQLFEDPELKHPIGNGWEYDKENGTVTLSPTNYPVGQIMVSGLSTEVVNRYEHGNVSFFPKDSGTDWGNLGTMYLATYIDLKTGKMRDVPQVQVVTLEGELPDTPRLAYSFTDDGRLHFNWTSVAGAEEYFICSMRYSEEYGLNSVMSVIATTGDTEWTSEAPEYGGITANARFFNYEVAQDDWYDEYDREKRIAEYGEEPIAIHHTENRYIYCVIAVSSTGSSMMSNAVDILDIQENLPVCVAYDTWVQNGYSYSGYENPEGLSPYGYVTMADGMTAMKLIDYYTEKAVMVEDRYVYTDEEGNFLEGKNLKVLKIPYRIEGTAFEDVAVVVDYEESNLEKDLAAIEEREDLLRKKAGDVLLDTDISFDEEEEAAREVREVDFAITANSALSEYLARNMLSGVTVIDVSEFGEAADASYLSDALLEAYYQNPLILGISGYRINRRGTAVKVAYDDQAAATAKKQEEIKEKVAEIIAQIITPDMTDLEKELAINHYLCNTCEYDDAALENARQSNYQYVDSEFNDSFTAYGALINGKCVCAGYAGAFKLLADAAGLEAVVVTGVMEGNLPHAWNKVKIDGEWEILDVTNNDNEFLVNALFNLPDEAGNRTLTEDSDYVLDGYMRNYAATNGQREYYRINNMYFDFDEVGAMLARQVQENGSALLRTEYSLDDETFNRIGQDVYAELDEEMELYGYYWMGVIYLTTRAD